MSILYQTSRAHLFWRTLAEWVDTAHLLEKRNASRLRSSHGLFRLPAAPSWTACAIPAHTVDFSHQEPHEEAGTQDRDSIPDGHNSLSMRPSMMMDFYNG